MSCKPILDHERVIWLETFFYSTTLLAYSITRGLERGVIREAPPPFNFFQQQKQVYLQQTIDMTKDNIVSRTRGC